MYNSVIIGCGDIGTSAIRPLESIRGKHYIAENDVAYLISKAYLDMGMTIFFNTHEGEQLTRMIAQNVDTEHIKRYIAHQYIRYVNPDVLMSAVDTAVKTMFEHGRKSKAEEIKSVLGLPDVQDVVDTKKTDLWYPKDEPNVYGPWIEYDGAHAVNANPDDIVQWLLSDERNEHRFTGYSARVVDVSWNIPRIVAYRVQRPELKCRSRSKCTTLLCTQLCRNQILKVLDRVIAIKDHEGFYKAGDRGTIIGVVYIPTMPYHILFDHDAPGRTMGGKWWADDTTVQKLLPQEDSNNFS